MFSDYLYKHLRPHRPVSAINYIKLYPSFLFPGKTQFLTEEFENYSTRIFHPYNPFNWKKTASNVLSQNTEHLVICYWHPFFAAALSRIVKFTKAGNPQVKVTILAHNVQPHEKFPFGRVLTTNLFNAADQVIVLSEQSILESKKLKLKVPVHKLFHPVYDQDFPKENKAELRSRYGFDPGDRILLFFGLIRKYKGLDLMIEALNKLNLQQLQIKPLIAGEFYIDKAQILERINPEHRDSYTVIDRFITNEEIAELFTLSDALIMPYRAASQSGILANAINFALPAIVSDLPGLTEFVDNNTHVLITEKENIEELRQAIKTFANSDLLASLSGNMKELKNQLSWEQFTSRFLSLIIN